MPTPTYFSLRQIAAMLSLEGEECAGLLAQAHRARVESTGEGIYLRGLVEYSNRCRKNCLYCGIRSEMTGLERYTLAEKDVLAAARYALREGYGSIVIQGGEITSEEHISTIERLVRQIKSLTPESVGVPSDAGWDRSLGITLSLGEQTPETYQRWRAAGATRYLLRIETSDPGFYARIHPCDGLHSFESRLKALQNLQVAGFMVGTGVMVGLPGQTVEQLAADLVFMRDFGIDMCGMGPYIESAGTPMAGSALRPAQWRVDMTLKMIAVLRLMMPDINIAAATALQALGEDARGRALFSGANVLMPNLTPAVCGRSYSLYDGKPFTGDYSLDNFKICRGKNGDPPRFKKTNNR